MATANTEVVRGCSLIECVPVLTLQDLYKLVYCLISHDKLNKVTMLKNGINGKNGKKKTNGNSNGKVAAAACPVCEPCDHPTGYLYSIVFTPSTCVCCYINVES